MKKLLLLSLGIASLSAITLENSLQALVPVVKVFNDSKNDVQLRYKKRDKNWTARLRGDEGDHFLRVPVGQIGEIEQKEESFIRILEAQPVGGNVVNPERDALDITYQLNKLQESSAPSLMISIKSAPTKESYNAITSEISDAPYLSIVNDAGRDLVLTYQQQDGSQKTNTLFNGRLAVVEQPENNPVVSLRVYPLGSEEKAITIAAQDLKALEKSSGEISISLTYDPAGEDFNYNLTYRVNK